MIAVITTSMTMMMIAIQIRICALEAGSCVTLSGCVSMFARVEAARQRRASLLEFGAQTTSSLSWRRDDRFDRRVNQIIAPIMIVVAAAAEAALAPQSAWLRVGSTRANPRRARQAQIDSSRRNVVVVVEKTAAIRQVSLFWCERAKCWLGAQQMSAERAQNFEFASSKFSGSKIRILKLANSDSQTEALNCFELLELRASWAQIVDVPVAS